MTSFRTAAELLKAGDRISFLWGYEAKTDLWWEVEMLDGEPHRAFHPIVGWKPFVYRDTFQRWAEECPPGVRYGVPVAQPKPLEVIDFQLMAMADEKWGPPSFAKDFET